MRNFEKRKTVLWFSRHAMSSAQRAALGDVKVMQVSGNLPNVHVPWVASIDGGPAKECPPLKAMIEWFDVVAIVAPVNLQQQVLQVAGQRPVIIAKNERKLVPSPDGGEDKVVFLFGGWERLLKIEVLTEPWMAL